MMKLPVRHLVELVMRSGDIDSRYVSKDRLVEGARAHRILQKNKREIYEDYRSEVFLSAEFAHNGLDYTLEGRADGIFCNDGKTVIDEIKTTMQPMTEIVETSNPVHWAQAKCYAYIYAVKHDLLEISVQLSYFHLETSESKQFLRTYSIAELSEFLTTLIEKYAVWASFSSEWEKTRNRSIKTLEFPFASYRKGQRELAIDVYRTIASGKKLFTQAPTGTGKTVSALFPAIKAIGEGLTSKIFYLTAKTITRQVTEEAFHKMRQTGLNMKTLTLTAKEKICFHEKSVCNPDYCEYAKGHYDRINEAILNAVNECDDLSRNTIEEYAKKHKVCPFELSLDISLLVDCVICDYNYVFDPRAHLRRFFTDTNSDYVFLIDEAHNLVDRSREMFSSELSKTNFSKVKKEYKGRSKALDKILNKINKAMIGMRSICTGQGYSIIAEKQIDFVNLIYKYTSACELLLKEDKSLREDNNFLQLYFDSLGFLTTSEFYDERYVTFIESERDEVTVKLFCVDPSHLLEEALKRGRSAVMFSATMSPLPYFREILGGGAEDKMLSLDSPFDRRRLSVITATHISTRYHNRAQSIQEIVNLIASFISCKTGNYIVYFPSYKYMSDVFEEFRVSWPDITAVKQEATMSEEDRESFLLSFKENPKQTYLAFCVLGGIFSEGIDLKGSRLIGTAIVSVGLPQLGVQQNILKDYFNLKNGMGYEYAYMYPGMNKVLQAAGRVIRSEDDTGAVLLIDERFSQKKYINLFPKHWHPVKNIKDHPSLRKTLTGFWVE